MPSPRRFGVSFFLAALAACVAAFHVRAQEFTFQLDRAQTKIEFTLHDVLHTVHGTFALESGTIRFDPANGKISGAILVDAASGESGNGTRDRRMHREILESAKFPEIVFIPGQMIGTVASKGASRVEVVGQLRLHGQDHDVTLPIDITAEGTQLRIMTHFIIPYVQWGVKNPSTFILRVSDKIEIDVHATGQVQSAEGPR